MKVRNKWGTSSFVISVTVVWY